MSWKDDMILSKMEKWLQIPLVQTCINLVTWSLILNMYYKMIKKIHDCKFDDFFF